MSNPAQTLIVIPDISGFSKFVNEMAISHAEHIITELLEIIIESNSLKLSVSEIEGDAVLFYKTGKLPKSKQIVEMTEKMFIRFHEHLLQYEQNRICQCGACRTANQLTLKMIVDQGEVKQVKVKKHVKLFGPALISAHRLLKNNVPSSEYLLVSENYITNNQDFHDTSDADWVSWEKDQYEYPSIGVVSFEYTLLSPLHGKLRSLEEQRRNWRIKNPIIIQREVAVNYQYAYDILTNDLLKVHWMNGLKAVIQSNPDEIHRIGSQHLCVIDNIYKVEFKATDVKILEGELSYIETLKKVGFLRDIAFFYRSIKLGEDRTLLKLELHYNPPRLFRPIASLAMKIFALGSKKSITALKNYLERTSAEQANSEPIVA